MKTRIIGILICSLVAIDASAQINLYGTVRDASGKGLPAVQITFKDYQYQTFTDLSGGFVLKNLRIPEENWTLFFNLNGYNEQIYSASKADLNRSIEVTMFTKTRNLEEISVNALRQNATKSSSTISSFKKKNFGQDIPFLLEENPSVVTTSDAGAGVGYTGIRVRGVDASRINVTINGIPVNDPESHDVYWVNMPDLASSVENLQLQRGVGSSTNGAGAFGASVNIKTNNISNEPFAEVDNSFGSFRTMKNTIKAGTGLLNNKFSMEMRLSRIKSNGYLDRASSDLSSYYLAGAYVGERTVIKAIAFSGKEITYQAWYGTPESRINGDINAMSAYADRNYLDSADRANLLNSGRTYNFYTYENEVDNYQQDNYQLHLNHRFNGGWYLNVAGHYTYGRGFYEQYRKGDELSNYGLSNVILGQDTVTSTDLIRRRWLDNHFMGAVYSINGQLNNLKTYLVFGGATNTYLGAHFGEIVWARFASSSEIRDRYYDNNAQKTETSHYLKTSTYLTQNLTLGFDMQYRFVHYQFLGIDEVNGNLVDLQQVVPFHFFNPKMSVNYTLDRKQQVFANIARSNREPIRRDFRESTPENRPKHESLTDIELGYQYRAKNSSITLNGYFMDYNNQLILTGQINDVGGYTRTNVKDSYRAGIELIGSARLRSFISVQGALTLSANKIASFTEFIDDYDIGGQAQILHERTDLAFSPNLTGNAGFKLMPIENLTIQWMTKYVSRQFLDNTSAKSRSINPFTFTNIMLNYQLTTKWSKQVLLGVQLNNFFNAMYENNGYTFSYIYGGKTITENFYYPQAGFNLMGRILIGF
ncbi:MAG: TonB-dependent receptor [Crocinitomicaceae bacterium]